MKKNILLLIIIFVIAIGIRFCQLPFFEFHNDQYDAIALGLKVKAAHFVYFRGMGAGAGNLDHPPGFLYLMGVVTAFTQDPATIAFGFFLINALALAISMIYFYRTLAGSYAILSSAFLALSPAFIVFAIKIWPPCFWPIILIFFHIFLYKFILEGKAKDFILMWAMAILAAQIHGGGFLWIIPVAGIATMVFYKKLDWKIIGWATLVIVILLFPYLIHLFCDGEFIRVAAYCSGHRTLQCQWKVIPNLWRMSCFDFFRGYFKPDFYQVIRAAAGPGGMVLYALSLIPGVLFMAGMFYYLFWLVKGRKFFNTSSETMQNYPLPFQISGLIVLSTVLGHFIFKVSASLHYCIVCFPAYGIMTGFIAMKLWKFYWGRIVVITGLLAMILLTSAVLVFIDKAGGHPYVYGATYKSMLTWQKEIQDAKVSGECFDLKVNVIGEDATEPRSLFAVLNQDNRCGPNAKITPAQFNVSWNDKLLRYEHTFTVSNH